MRCSTGRWSLPCPRPLALPTVPLSRRGPHAQLSLSIEREAEREGGHRERGERAQPGRLLRLTLQKHANPLTTLYIGSEVPSASEHAADTRHSPQSGAPRGGYVLFSPLRPVHYHAHLATGHVFFLSSPHLTSPPLPLSSLRTSSFELRARSSDEIMSVHECL